MHRIATEYGQTPAEQMGIRDVLEAYVINRAVLYAGLNEPEKPKALL